MRVAFETGPEADLALPRIPRIYDVSGRYTGISSSKHRANSTKFPRAVGAVMEVRIITQSATLTDIKLSSYWVCGGVESHVRKQPLRGRIELRLNAALQHQTVGTVLSLHLSHSGTKGKRQESPD